MTSDEVLIEFAIRADALPWGFDMAQRRVNLMADEIVRLRERLAAVEAERDALRDQLTHQTITLTAEHQRAERILAALREPSEAVLQAAGHEVLRYVDPNEGDMRSAIIAAVAAAEQEVNNER